MAQRKNPELDAKHQAILRKMMQIPENKTCADCRGPSPRWASTNLGVFVCISCSGIHRKLGTHISQVRSVTLDTWTPAQVAHFTKFGNARAAQYFEACVPLNFQRPQPGDSMQMERFIRDKYENKRYITVENGGLGGGSLEPAHRPNTGSSFGRTLGSRPSQVRGTLSYNGGGYDGAQTTRRAGKSTNSYGGRFGSGSLFSPSADSGSVQGRRTGGISEQAPSAWGSRPVNAMQRASTMKELINMGFSAQHAARAVEAAKGDLQKAVDWVLEHNDEGNGPNISSSAPPRKQAPERDLLDFSNPEPTPQITAKPKALDSEVLMATTSKTTQVLKGSDDLADFADFGAFESALPAAKEQSSGTGIVASNGPLGSALRKVYKKSPPQRAQAYVNGMPQMSRLDQPKQTSSPQSSPIRTKPSPKLMAQKAAEAIKKVPQADLGLTSFTGLAKNRYQFSSLTTNEHPSRHQTTDEVISASPKGIKGPPPPPPPQMEVSASKSIQDPWPPTPPPPDSPPPAEERSTDLANSSASELMAELTSSNQRPEQDDRTNTNESVQVTSPQNEEEDPFAALSVMAMTSAKSSIQKVNQVPNASLQLAADGIVGTSTIPQRVEGSVAENAGATVTSNGINLDELLG